jgi:hypothetical protein
MKKFQQFMYHYWISVSTCFNSYFILTNLASLLIGMPMGGFLSLHLMLLVFGVVFLLVSVLITLTD